MSTQETTIPKHVKLAVKKGVTFLDEHYPEWLDAIDLSELDMENAGRCILGQVEEDGSRDHYPYGYDVAVEKHGLEDGVVDEGIPSNLVYDLGFNLGGGATWEQLQAAWEDQVRRLREDQS